MEKRPATFDHLIGKKKPLQRTIPIVLDPDLAEDYEIARKDRDMLQARHDLRPDDMEVAAKLEQAETRVRDVEEQLTETEGVVWMTFKGIGRARFDALQEAHPPTAEQQLKAKQQLGTDDRLAWNPETFPPALVAASLVEPKLSEVEVQRLWTSDDWNQAELTTLVQTALEVNSTRRTVEVGKDTRGTRASGSKSGTARNAGSRTRSS